MVLNNTILQWIIVYVNEEIKKKTDIFVNMLTCLKMLMWYKLSSRKIKQGKYMKLFKILLHNIPSLKMLWHCQSKQIKTSTS